MLVILQALITATRYRFVILVVGIGNLLNLKGLGVNLQNRNMALSGIILNLILPKKTGFKN